MHLVSSSHSRFLVLFLIVKNGQTGMNNFQAKSVSMKRANKFYFKIRSLSSYVW